jgi:hypothetical protein
MSIESDILWTQTGGILRGDEYGDYFGGAISMNNEGTRIVVSGKLGDKVLANAGYVAVYEKSGRSWKQVGETLNGGIIHEQFGASVAISGDGSTVAVGAPWNDTSGTESGNVRVYRYTYDVTAKWSWTIFGNTLSGDQAYDRFGSSLSLNYDGTRFVSGSPNANTGGNDAGHVRSYEYTGGVWLLMGGVARGAGIGYKAGTSVAMNHLGDNVVVGSPYHTTTAGVVTGGAVVTEWADDSWSQKGSTLEGRYADDVFGSSVSIDKLGETVAVGAPGVSLSVIYTGPAAYRGYVDVYRWEMTDVWDVYDWALIGHLMGGEAEKEYFGFSVSLNMYGNLVAVGAPELTHEGKAFSGGVTVFHRADNLWAQHGERLSGQRSEQYFGSAVAVSGDGSAVLVGSPGVTTDGASPGSVSLYQVLSPASSSTKLELNEILGITNLVVLVALFVFSFYAFFVSKKQNRRARIAYETTEAIEENNRKENVNMAF